MKYNIVLLIVCLICFNSNAQNGFVDHAIIDKSSSADGVISVFTVDLDGDGDMDVLSASELDNKIAWHENTDGLGSFGEQQYRYSRFLF